MWHIRTEQGFRRCLPDLLPDPPDLIVLDLLIPWGESSDAARPIPEEILRDGAYRGGLRCLTLLREHAETKDTPVVIYSVFGEQGVVRKAVEQNGPALHLRKGVGDGELARAIRNLAPHVVGNRLPNPTLRQRLLAALEIKPSLGPVSLDLMKLFPDGSP